MSVLLASRAAPWTHLRCHGRACPDHPTLRQLGRLQKAGPRDKPEDDTSAAPGAAHALADARCAVDVAARGHEAAHSAGVGRQAAAIGAAAAVIAGANDLAIAPGVQAGRLRPHLGGREGGHAAGEQRQTPRAHGSHRDNPGTLCPTLLSARNEPPATAAGSKCSARRVTVPRRPRRRLRVYDFRPYPRGCGGVR